MSLTNAQYDTILHQYEMKQLKSRRETERRLARVYDQIPGYRKLEDTVAAVSVAQGKKLLSGDEDAMEDLRDSLAELSGRKVQLLEDAGFAPDYLEPVYECPDCQDTGYIGSEKCHCFKQAMITLLYEQSNIREMLRTENFDSLSYEYYEGEDLSRFKNAVRTCRNFVKNFNSDYHNLFFYGTVGTGKSFLSGCVAKELIESGHSVIYFSTTGLFDLLSKNSFDYKNREELRETYADLYQCDLLIIDDLGTELNNAFVSSQLFYCINERISRGHGTVISTNLSMGMLRDTYSDRVTSRIMSHYTTIPLYGPDIRLMKNGINT